MVSPLADFFLHYVEHFIVRLRFRFFPEIPWQHIHLILVNFPAGLIPSLRMQLEELPIGLRSEMPVGGCSALVRL